MAIIYYTATIRPSFALDMLCLVPTATGNILSISCISDQQLKGAEQKAEQVGVLSVHQAPASVAHSFQQPGHHHVFTMAGDHRTRVPDARRDSCLHLTPTQQSPGTGVIYESKTANAHQTGRAGNEAGSSGRPATRTVPCCRVD